MRDPLTLIGSVGPVELWHRDAGGVDGACGWFMRSSHGDRNVLDAIIRRFGMDWDRTIRLHDGTLSPMGLFDGSAYGWPAMSIHAIALNLFFWAAFEHFKHDRTAAAKFMKVHLAEILLFAENPTDSAHTGWLHRYGVDERETREQRIVQSAGMIYGWILRESRPWFRHPRWHIHHWRVTCRSPRWFRNLRRAA